MLLVIWNWFQVYFLSSHRKGLSLHTKQLNLLQAAKSAQLARLDNRLNQSPIRPNACGLLWDSLWDSLPARVIRFLGWAGTSALEFCHAGSFLTTPSCSLRCDLKTKLRLDKNL